MKRLFAICLLSFLCAHILGFYCYYVFRIIEIREEVRKQLETLPAEALQRFEMSMARFESIRVDDHEVSIEGRLYDICRFSVTGDKVVVFALHDDAEENLMLGLRSMLKMGLSDSKPVPSAFLSYFQLHYLVSCFSVEYPEALQFSGDTKYLVFPDLYEPPFITPPPQA